MSRKTILARKGINHQSIPQAAAAAGFGKRLVTSEDPSQGTTP
jgi:hypothetical protein